ncbi:YheC/YheD family protein [Cytobacillus suaedae]|nr:YheC/YheD family protein [Cytobacillus suaedae]
MITFGFITIHPNQENTYITEIGRRSDSNIIVYRFIPTSIDPSTEKVHGEKFNHETGEWETAVFDIPMYLYDRCFYGDDPLSVRSQPIMNWLKNRPYSTFIGLGLPNKWEIYNVLRTDEELAAYTPKTIKASSVPKIINKLIKDKKLLLKPKNGSQGKGIIGLIVTKGKVEALTHKNQKLITKSFLSKSEFSNWLNQLLSSRDYMCQQLLPLQDEDNHPFDIRILLQKNENGEWIEQGRGIRRGLKDHLISNINAGAEVLNYDDWVNALPIQQQALLTDGITTVLNLVPKLLEREFVNLFELGIDIGFGLDGGVWILDINSKPGRKVILQSKEGKADELYSAPLRYCSYLEKQSLVKGVD